MNWHDSFTTQPMAHENQNDFFHIVPPTPLDGTQHTLAHQGDGQTLFSHDHHLRPTSHRSHRAASAGSISSAYSNYTQWGSESDYTEPKTQPQSFHVDPKLFQAKERSEDDEVQAAQPVKKKNRKAKTPVDKDDRKKVSHARKQAPEHIPRPRNAFILFRKHVVDSKLIPTSVEIRHQNVSIITAKMWAEASPEQKAHFNELAKIEKEEHMKKYPGYRYQPVYRRTNVIRRRVRKDEAEEEKCRNVAQLLLEGKTGEKLAEEIKDTGNEKKVTKGTRAPSKKGQANELSKGALRALRAQSRQTGEWSDASRSVSRAVSPEPEMDDFNLSQLDMPFGPGPVIVPDVYAQPQPVWGYSQPMAEPYAHEQTYDAGTSQLYTQQPAYSNYDPGLSLPFTSSTPAIQARPQPGTTGMRQGVADMVFSAFPDNSQSPTTFVPAVPMSARWDGIFDNGADVPGNSGYEGLDFGGQDSMLHDFGSALAQAETMESW